MAYVIAIANQKGGVAKTTTVASLSGALAAGGFRVLAVDLDAQADLTLNLGAAPDQTKGVVSEVVLNGGSLAGIVRETAIPGLSLVPSSAEMETAERFLPMRSEYETVLHTALQDAAIQRAYDVVILDCPPYLGAVTTAALTAADLLIIPTQPEYFSAHALRSMMGVIRKVRTQGNPNLVYRILITMQDRRNRIHRSLSEQIQTTFGDGLLRTVIEVDTKLRESAIAGVPVNYYLAKTRSALQYQALAQELAQYVQKKAVQPA